MSYRLDNIDWENKIQVRKGSIGEKIVENYIEKKGYIVYKPSTKEAHPFDMLCIKGKKEIIIAEIKTKPKRKYYPDTGFNYQHYKDYLYIQEKGLNVFIFFVDEELDAIYGNWLQTISKEKSIMHNGKTIKYPLIINNIIYFPVISMETIIKLTEIEIATIKSLYSGKYE